MIVKVLISTMLDIIVIALILIKNYRKSNVNQCTMVKLNKLKNGVKMQNAKCKMQCCIDSSSEKFLQKEKKWRMMMMGTLVKAKTKMIVMVQ